MSSPSLSGTSNSNEDSAQALNQRKRKRMLSNRESARRSRLRKQKHLDDLSAQVALLRKENNHILTSYNMVTQQLLTVDSENSVLRTQTLELNNRLQSLNEIIIHLNGLNDGDQMQGSFDGFLGNPWSSISLNQAIMASPDMYQ